MLPAWLVLSLALAGSAIPLGAGAQERVRATQEENMRPAPRPSSALLARVMPGTELVAGAADGDWIEVTLEGWIWSASVGPSSREGYELTVTRSGGENLRTEPNGRQLARVQRGTQLNEIERRSRWVRVRRTAWMWRASVTAIDASARPAGPDPTAAPDSTQPALDRVVTSGETVVLRSPGGDTLGTLPTEMPARVLTRSGEWVRVQFEGWVRDTELRPAAAGVLVGVSGAEVRARPGDYQGRTIQWTLQYLGVEIADEMRREIPEGSVYFLGRGPMPEVGFVYVIVPGEHRAAIEDLEPLAEITVIGRVRSGRSRFVGNPVLDLIDFAIAER